MSPHLAADLSQSAFPGGAMTVDEFSKWAKIGRTALYKEAKSGRLILRKFGSKTLILHADAERWLESLPAIVTKP